MNIAFVGAGYVGLVSGVMLSNLGHSVICLDNNEDKVNDLNNNILPIYEPGLADYLEKAKINNKLSFKTNYDLSLTSIKVFFIAVGTPSLACGRADLSYVFSTIDSILPFAQEHSVIVIKSTVPPGSGKVFADYITKKSNKVLHLVVNPEFLREGSAVHDFLNPDRIVLGCTSDYAFQVMLDVYTSFVQQKVEIINTSTTTAELIKYASNSFLATKIAFINEMADLCEATGSNIKELSHAMGLDHRIGKDFLSAGPGFGGSCFPKDLLALTNIARELGVDAKLLNAVIHSNGMRSVNIVNKVKAILDGDLTNKKCAILGVTFKAGTDDIRSSPSLEIIKKLREQNAVITIYDPVGMPKAQELMPDLIAANSALNACIGADIILIATEWQEFVNLDFKQIYDKMRLHIIYDLRNILLDKKLSEIGFKYYSIGTQHE